MVDLDEYVCGLDGQAEDNGFHSNLLVLVATNKNYVQVLLLSQRIYVKVECDRHQWIYSQMD